MALTTIISGIVGQEIVTETSKSIFHSLGNLLSHCHPTINNLLSDLDIPAQIKLTRTIIIDIQILKINTASIKVSLEQMDDIVKRIEKQVEIIKQGIDYHKSLWFSRWRTAQYETEILELKKLKIIMNTRLENLLNILQISNN
tara:strand:- start:590 stop:1018 length:429 start_codon:yes stop_codon:yes gene_type:complete